MANHLLVKDVDPNSVVFEAFKGYLVASDPSELQAILDVLKKIELPPDQPRPNWQKLLDSLSGRFNQLQDSNTPQPAGK